MNIIHEHKKENICYCGHTAIEHEGVCQQPDCGCPEFVDSLEAASYLSGHHPTSCACDTCRNAKELVASAGIAQQVRHFTHWPVKSYCGAAIASIPINSSELTGDESRVTCQECLRAILRQKAEHAQISEQCKILGY